MKRLNIAVLSDLIVRVRHAQFLTLVDIGRSLHTMENRSQHLSGLHAVFLIIAPPRYDPRQIMIIPKEAVPAASLQFTLPFVQNFLEFYKRKGGQIPFLPARYGIQHNVFELEHHGELASIRRAVELCTLRIGAPALAYGDDIALLKCLAAQFADKFMKAGSIARNL